MADNTKIINELLKHKDSVVGKEFAKSVIFKVNETFTGFEENIKLNDRVISKFLSKQSMKDALNLPYPNFLLNLLDFAVMVQGAAFDGKYHIAMTPFTTARNYYKEMFKQDRCVVVTATFLMDGTLLNLAQTIFQGETPTESINIMEALQKFHNDGDDYMARAELFAPCVTLDIVHKFAQFCNCKNIKFTNRTTFKKSKGKPKPLFSYKELQLESFSTKSNGNKTPQNLWSNRIHLCRGHFKEYTEEKPLLGRFVGKFWFAPHVRGNKKKGVIHKSYKTDKL